MIVRAYLDGVEIDKISELREICDLDDWLGGLLRWVREHRPGSRIEAFFSMDSVEPMLAEVWVGGAPPLHGESRGWKKLQMRAPVKS